MPVSSAGADPVLLRNGRLADGEPSDVALAGGSIAAVEQHISALGRRVIDLAGATIAPGFVDLQINGGFGADFTADPASMWLVGERLRRFGVTAFLPTLVSTELERIEEARRVVTAGPPHGYQGAAVWGLHVEGPFLAPSRSGAHDVAKLRHPSPELVSGWSPAAGVAVVTLAPELPGALSTIRTLVANGVVVSLGHSDADHAEAAAGFGAGARMVTHLYNAMSTGDHRTPGLAIAALADRRVSVGMIVDNVHLHPVVTAAAWRALGPARTVLVSDAIAALGAGDLQGGHQLGDKDVTISGGAPRLAGGTLAGSLLSLDAAIRNLRDATGASISEIVATVTSTPAGLLGRHRRIAPGEPADLTILDADLSIAGTVVGGSIDSNLESRAL